MNTLAVELATGYVRECLRAARKKRDTIDNLHNVAIQDYWDGADLDEIHERLSSLWTQLQEARTECGRLQRELLGLGETLPPSDEPTETHG